MGIDLDGGLTRGPSGGKVVGAHGSDSGGAIDVSDVRDVGDIHDVHVGLFNVNPAALADV